MKKIIFLMSLLSVVIYGKEFVYDAHGGTLPQDFSLFDGVENVNSLERDSINNKFERYQGQDADYLTYEDLDQLANSRIDLKRSDTRNLKDNKISWQAAFVLAFQRFIEKYLYAK